MRADGPGKDDQPKLALDDEDDALPDAPAPPIPPTRRLLAPAVLLLGAAAIGLLWGGIALHAHQARQREIAQVHRDVGNLSAAVRDDVQRTLASVDQVLRFIAAEHRDDPAAFDFAAWLRRADSLRDVVIQILRTDADGIALASSLGPMPDRLSLADRAGFRVHAEDPDAGLFVSRAVFGRLSRRWGFQLTRRLEHPDGRFAGVVIAAIDPDALAARFAALDIGDSGAVTLTGTDGFIRARVPRFAGMYETAVEVSAAGAPRILGDATVASGTTQGISPFDGVERIVGFRKLPDMPLAVSVSRSVEVALAPIAAETRRLVAAGGVLSLTLGGLCALLLRAIGRRRRDEEALRAAHAGVAEAEAAARARNRSLLAAERVAQMGHWRLELPAGRLTWSPETFRIHGMRRTEGQPDLAAAIAAYHPEDRPIVEGDVAAAIEAGRAYEFRLRLKRQDGEIRHVVSRGRAERDATGAVTAIFGTIIDVTEQRRVELELAESEARYRLLAETASDVVIRFDCQLRRRYVSPSVERLLGFTAAEMLSDRPGDALHKDDAATVRDGMQALAAGTVPGDALTLTYRRRHRDGRWIAIESAMRLARDAAGAPESVVCGLRDVTARRDAEAALRQSEAQFRLLAEHSGDVVALSGLDGVRRYVSPAASRVLGWAPEDLVGRSVRDFVHPDDLSALAAAQAALGNGETANGTTYRHRQPDGGWLWVEGRARVHRDPLTGETLGYVVVIRDASARVAEEESRRLALDQMRVMAETDPLTGLANRRRFEAALDAEWRRAAREGGSVALIMIDADRFKLFNDRYGHPAGDACIRAIAAAVETVARRPGDIAARLGGEEFALLMPATDATGAGSIAERVREAVLHRAVPHADNPPEGFVTVSVGVATARPVPLLGGAIGDGPTALIEAADVALYGAKTAGRNRVVAAMEPARASETPAAVMAA